jgi:hypothetical protein
MFRSRRLAAIVAAVIATVGMPASTALAAQGRVPVPPPGFPSIGSPTMAGYVALPKSGGATSFDHVLAHYFVPTLNCGMTPNATVEHWAGLDGFSDSTLEQVGVVENCTSGSPAYYTSYDMYPAAPKTLPVSISPGQSVESSVSYNSSTGRYSLMMINLTTGQSATRSAACPTVCDNSSAEVMSSGTADFNEVNFEDIDVTDSAGLSGGLAGSSWNTDEVVQTSPPGITPGPLSTTTRSAFANIW